ncbi:MAG: hypothetical protein JW889_11850 [Verrucomicrobia bacterium]|nr:hypothetical protein [Verrucomicrobiota bacterium]
MDDIRMKMEGLEPDVFEDPEERDRIFCFKCDKEFVVEHVGERDAWVCPACAWSNLNLHKHFLVLGILFGLLAIVGLALTVRYAFVYQEHDITFLYLMWSAINTTATGYAALAIFSDRRAYGLRALRYLLPALYASAIAAAIVYWFPFDWVTVIISAAVFAGIGVYGGYVFWHTLRMAVSHKPREAVVRPMYTLISVTAHVLLMLYMALATYVVAQRTPGTSDVEFGKPGGYVPQNLEVEDLQLEEIEVEDELIEPEIEEIVPPEVRDIDYLTDNDMIFTKKETEEETRLKPKRQKRNPQYQQRYNREYALEEGGGSDKTEWAVLQALRWLKAHQNGDGSWGDPPIQPSLTGLALLCFLGHGEDHLSIEFGEAVRKAITWFVEQQDDEGYFTRQPSREWWVYQHGIASYAMAEAYGLTELEDLRPVASKAIRRICEGQTPQGGWYYGYDKVKQDGTPWPGGDTSVCGWHVQALTAAKHAGIEFSDNMVAAARRRAIDDLKSRFSRDSGFGYQETGPSRDLESNYCTTAIGTLCLQFLGQWRCAEVSGGLDIMSKYSCSWTKTSGGSGGPLYGWYYATQAMFQGQHSTQGKRVWKRWNDLLSPMLTSNQDPDGHWKYPEGGNAALVRNAINGTSSDNLDVYTTAMCCLMLEVYYRYSLTYRTQVQ